VLGLCLGVLTTGARAADAPDLGALLAKPVLDPNSPMSEAQAFCEARVPPVPRFDAVAEWEQHANKLRADVLEKIVFRGEAQAWRDAPGKVEWLDTIEGGPGYKIRKLRYEALPGLWIPALLYLPDNLTGKVPAILNVNGHEPKGKAAPYKQLICINQAKRGMLALNVEWIGLGQLNARDYGHNRLVQLDLCGTSGMSVFYLCMSRALDLLLAHENADPARVAVTGLSGGGWQTIVISSLDTRVKLTDPVAGYSSLRTRARNLSDLGDAEQTPNDLATIADYSHLTAMMAPRPTLLTYNVKDDCCFASVHALPPLLEAAGPVFELYGKRESLRSHVNLLPGNHNYDKDNRQAFYRMLAAHFYPGDPDFKGDEIPSEMELKSEDALKIDVPAGNQNFNTLALAVAKAVPREPALPTDRAAADRWQAAGRAKLREIVRLDDHPVAAERLGAEDAGGLSVTTWRLKLGADWTIPAVELAPANAKPAATAIVVNDAGRAASADVVRRLLDSGHRVLAVDPFLIGESKPASHDYLLGLLLAAVGERPIGLQAGQLIAVAKRSRQTHPDQPVTIVATGPRTTTAALIATALEPAAVAGAELNGAIGSFKELIEQSRSVDELPEMFCFGLLESFDVPQLTALAAPRSVRFATPSERAKAELAPLKAWYTLLGVANFNPAP
jgi:dienelactone hydrolase